MSRPQEPQQAKLIAGFLFRDFQVRDRVMEAMTELFGPLDFLSEARPFTYTAYYDKEMGEGLQRQVCSFADLVATESLVDTKLSTNGIENRYLVEGKRRINIDPGILSEERLVLATGKNYIHRIYLRDGIYADLTLIYEEGSYRPLPWTYPDYRDERLLRFLGALRHKLIYQRRGRLPRSMA